MFLHPHPLALNYRSVFVGPESREWVLCTIVTLIQSFLFISCDNVSNRYSWILEFCESEQLSCVIYWCQKSDLKYIYLQDSLDSISPSIFFFYFCFCYRAPVEYIYRHLHQLFTDSV